MPRIWRLPALVWLLVTGLLIEAIVFPVAGRDFRRWAIRHWSAALVRACGLTFEADQILARVAPGCLIVANHVSWLDVFAINSVAPSAFAAKSEIRRWPLLGHLVAMAGTVFIERGRRHALRAVVARVQERLREGWPVAVFPEATTSDGRHLLPFHGNVIEAACAQRRDVLVVALDYRDQDGAWPQPLTWVNAPFGRNLWQVIGCRGISVQVSLVETLTTNGRSRHDIAREARAALSRRLGLPLVGSGTETVRPSQA